MKKIYLSILAIVATVGIVSGAAYALFSDTVTVSGLTVSTGNADLELNYSGDNADEHYSPDDNIIISYIVDGLYPGFEDNANFHLRNISDSDFYLRPKIKLTNAGTDWATLKDVIQIKITDKGTDNTGTYSWGWQNLSWWNTEHRTISDNPGIQNETNSDDTLYAHNYKIEVKVLESAGNSISGKTLSNVTFEIVADQVNVIP